MNRLDELQHLMRPTGWRISALLIAGVISGAIIWAHYAKLEEVSVANGEVIPYGQTKVIQHLEGGIISAIDVSEGDEVNQGQIVMKLDRNIIGSTREEILIELDGLILTRDRLISEASETPYEELKFSDEIAKRRPDIVTAEREKYSAHQRELLATIEVLDEQRNQRELEKYELTTQLQSAEDNLRLSAEKLAMSEDLLEDELTPKLEHKKLEQEFLALQGQARELKASISRSDASIIEAIKRITEEKTRYQRLSQDELSDVEKEISRVRQELSRATDQVVRSAIKSPIDGLVKSIRHNTIGGVVKPGEPIMEIVPTQERLVIEARLDPSDIGYVRVGLPATVKISTYDFTRYGSLEGVVTSISADSLVDPATSRTFFKVVTETKKTYLGKYQGDLPIAPGMHAIVDIRTGSKSVLEYLLKPVISAKSEALRER